MTLDRARRMIDAALAEAERLGARMNIAVVDAGGNLVAHVRMDGSFFGSVDIAIAKAWTSAAFRTPSGDLGPLVAPGGPAYGLDNVGRMMPVPGGVPVEVDGEIVGAIGASGGSVEQDLAVALAGCEAAVVG